jgi:hypothetical protein
LRGFGLGHAAHPVHHLLGRHLHGAVDVTGGDAGGSEQGDLQAGGVEGVAALVLQGEVGLFPLCVGITVRAAAFKTRN